MNFGVIALALFLVVAATAGLFALAGNAPSTSYMDTYGNLNTAQTNTTRTVVVDSTSPALFELAGGVVIIMGFFFALVLIIITIRSVNNPHSGYRSGRY
jgi:hypothetical protein